MENDWQPNSKSVDQFSLSDQRSLIFHLLYAVDGFNYDTSLEAVIENFNRGFSIIIPKESDVYKETLSIIEDRKELDKEILPLLANWRIERLGTITKLILRLGIWELLKSKTDVAVIINECVELAKCFAEKDAYKFINGILDEFAKSKNLNGQKK